MKPLSLRCLCFGLTFVALFVDILGLDQPVHVADHVFLHLFALLRLLQLTAGHRLLPFLGELAENERKIPSAHRRSGTWRDALAVDERQRCRYEPAQHTQYEVDDEKRSKDDKRHKVNPGNLEANGVIHLWRERKT